MFCLVFSKVHIIQLGFSERLTLVPGSPNPKKSDKDFSLLRKKVKIVFSFYFSGSIYKGSPASEERGTAFIIGECNFRFYVLFGMIW